MPERCLLGFDEETKRRLRADYAERGRGPIRQENCQCGRPVVAESIGGMWLPRPHYPPSPTKAAKTTGRQALNPSDQGP
jgi:hypothetical protein